jgi:hypothetical protein
LWVNVLGGVSLGSNPSGLIGHSKMLNCQAVWEDS